MAIISKVVRHSPGFNLVPATRFGNKRKGKNRVNSSDKHIKCNHTQHPTLIVQMRELKHGCHFLLKLFREVLIQIYDQFAGCTL